ncbi:hypothetical protein Tco_1155328 [Tanacetum coccineum]
MQVSITTEFAKAVHYQQESDSLPHASCPQGYKDIHLANDILKIKKLSMNEDKTSTTLLIIKSSFKISRYQDKDSREIIRKRFPDDAKYEHVGEDIRSQDGKDDKDLKHKDLNILELKNTTSKQSQETQGHVMTVNMEAWNLQNQARGDKHHEEIHDMDRQSMNLASILQHPCEMIEDCCCWLVDELLDRSASRSIVVDEGEPAMSTALSAIATGTGETTLYEGLKYSSNIC